MITIRPFGGLCNRLRSIDSLMALTKPANIPVQVNWELNQACNCEFDKLFTLPERVFIHEKKIIQFEKILKAKYLVSRLYRESGLQLPTGKKKSFYERDMVLMKEKQFDFRELLKYESMFIESQDRFYSNGNDFEDFIPNPFIQQRVHAITRYFPSDMVGVHIRRTDNIKAIEQSPLESFIDEMQETVDKNRETTFFLATDSPDVENTLKKRFPGLILTQENKKLGRNNSEAIQDALVDLLCLSKTRRILGSYWSSFSETAAAMGKIDLQIVKQNHPITI